MNCYHESFNDKWINYAGQASAYNSNTAQSGGHFWGIKWFADIFAYVQFYTRHLSSHDDPNMTL